MTNETRWQDWLHKAKERAAMLETAAPLARPPKARSRRQPAEPPAAPPSVWYEPNPVRYPVQDAPNLITLTAPVDQWATVVRKVQQKHLRKNIGNWSSKGYTVKSKDKAA